MRCTSCRESDLGGTGIAQREIVEWLCSVGFEVRQGAHIWSAIKQCTHDDVVPDLICVCGHPDSQHETGPEYIAAKARGISAQGRQTRPVDAESA